MRDDHNLKLINKSKNLSEEEFKIQMMNGYTLRVSYEYETDGQKIFLDYTVFREKSNLQDKYVLCIEEGSALDLYHDHCTIRDQRFSFNSVKDVITYLKEKEYFKVSDWNHLRKSRFQK
ncbi:hypothetical protein HYW21_05835 [Candidatus Woesearchaeota archaeon]|nr:hypothetical protein [Candidatus Woesearchaeota archaeon]